MDPNALGLIVDLGAGFASTFLGTLKNKVPQELLDAAQTAFDAIVAHKDDVITKAALEAQRG